MASIIGIIGGVGPYAGLDMVRKVLDNTQAQTDQEHLDLVLSSCPSLIPDRSGFLLRGGVNPSLGMLACAEKLIHAGAGFLTVACNTAHAPAIFDPFQTSLQERYPQVRLINLIQSACLRLIELFPRGGRVGLLATLGTYQADFYRTYLARYPGWELLEPPPEEQALIHQAIYDPGYGIKGVFPVTKTAQAPLNAAAARLTDRGAQALILGCTELPLAFAAINAEAPTGSNSAAAPASAAIPLIDPALCAARALIKAAAPEKLKESAS